MNQNCCVCQKATDFTTIGNLPLCWQCYITEDEDFLMAKIQHAFPQQHQLVTDKVYILCGKKKYIKCEEIYGKSILHVCDKLHGEACGSGEGSYYSTYGMEEDIQWLRNKLKVWETPSHKRKLQFDLVVKELILATIEEAIFYIDVIQN